MNPFAHWLLPGIGERIRQHRPHGPFVVQHREELGLDACRLTRHRTATRTTFTVLAYAERSEIGLPCFVIHLEDDRDGCRYVLDTGLCGPGLPPDMFSVLPGAALGTGYDASAVSVSNSASSWSSESSSTA